MNAPAAGTAVLALFPGTAGPLYHAGTGEAGGAITMLPVRLPAGHHVYVPDVEGVALLPGEWATMLAQAVLESVQFWDPGIDIPDCPDCQAATEPMCSTHRADQARSDEFRQLLHFLTALGIDAEAAGT